MRRRGPKAKSQMRHARRRAVERFDLELSRFDMLAIVRRIQAGDAEHVETQSRRLTVFRIVVQGRTMFPVYDSVRKTIATFLTEQMIKEREMGS